jgi:hypothetical protein
MFLGHHTTVYSPLQVLIKLNKKNLQNLFGYYAHNAYYLPFGMGTKTAVNKSLLKCILKPCYHILYCNFSWCAAWYCSKKHVLLALDFQMTLVGQCSSENHCTERIL